MHIKITALDPSCANYTPEEISAIRARNFKHMLDLFAQGNISTFASRFGLNRTVASLIVNQRTLFTDSYVRKFTERLDFAINIFDCPSSYDFFVRVLRQINSFEGVFLSCVPEEIRQRMANGEELEEQSINTIYSNTQPSTTSKPTIEQHVVTATEISPPTTRRGRPSRNKKAATPQEISFIAPIKQQETIKNQQEPCNAKPSESEGATFNIDKITHQELRDTILLPRNPNTKNDDKTIDKNSTSITLKQESQSNLNLQTAHASKLEQDALVAHDQYRHPESTNESTYSPMHNIYGGIFIQPLIKEFVGRLFYHGNDYTDRSVAELEQLGLQFAARAEAKRLTQPYDNNENPQNWYNNLDYISTAPIFLSEYDYWSFFGRITNHNQHIHSQLAAIRVLSEANLPELTPFQNCIVRLTTRFSKTGYYLFRYQNQLYLRHLSILADKLYCHASNNAFESFLVAHNEIHIIGRVVIALDYKTLS